MVTIKFPDKATEKKALGFLLGRFSGRILRTGEHVVPEAAVPALASENFSFTVLGKATYEQLTAPFKKSETKKSKKVTRRKTKGM